MKKLFLMLAVIAVLAIVAACAPATTVAPTSAPPTSAPAPTKAPSAAAGKIAILLPETKTARYESQDLPNFKAKLQALGYDLSNLIYSNANQDAVAQQSQADAALTNGAKVLVLDPVDATAAAVIADKAKAAGVPVISYDRLLQNTSSVAYYISFDNAKVGQLQGQSLLDALTKAGKTNPTVVFINGSPTDPNAALFKSGAHSVLDGKVTLGKEYDTPDWSPDKAQTEMQQALTALNNKVDGVLAANDGTGGGAIAAMKAAGLKPLPPTTGQDAELAAIQRILAGEQYMTVYKAIKPEAEAAATLAYDLLTGTPVPAGMTNGKVNNGKMDVPSILLVPVAVTKDNVKSTVVADGFWTVAQICTADFASACAAAGLSGGAAPAPTAAPSGLNVTGSITIWDGYHTGDNEEKAINQLVDAATKAFPNAKITVLEIPFDQLFKKFETETASGGGPDMYIAPNDNLGSEVRAGLLQPIDSMVTGQLSPFSKLSIQALTVDGKLYAVPMVPKAVAMYYNKTTITTPPATTDDLMAAVKAGKKVGISNSAYHTFGWWGAFGGSLMDSTNKCVADTTGAADAFTYLLALKAAGATIDADTKLDTLYRQGALDIYFNGPWVLGGNEDALGKDKVGVAPIPKGPKGNAGPITGLDGFYINVNSKNQQSAVNLALFFASKDGQTVYANVAGDPPARTDVVATDPNITAFAAAAASGFPRPQVVELNNFWGPFGDANTNIFEGKATPADAFKTACAAMNKANNK